MKKGMLFIDGSNMFVDYLTQTGKRVDVAKYINHVKYKFRYVDFVRTYYFATETEANKSLLHQINRFPYCQVITGCLQSKSISINETHGLTCECGKTITGKITTNIDKGTDVNIAVEMLKHAYMNSYDTAVLVSRDADFASVVRIIKNLGKNVELVLFEDLRGSAKELTDCVDSVTLINRRDYYSLALPDLDDNIDE